MNRDKVYKFRFYPFNYPVYVLFTDKAVRKFIKVNPECRTPFLLEQVDTAPKNRKNTASSIHYTSGSLIWMDLTQMKNKQSIQSFAVHEAVHVFDRAMQYIGEDTPSKELKAYGIQFIYDGVCFYYNHP